MEKNKKRIEILEKLRENNFIHLEDYNKKLKELINDLDDSDIDSILKEESLIKKNNIIKEKLIDGFNQLIINDNEILDYLKANHFLDSFIKKC